MSLRSKVDDFCKTATDLGRKIDALEKQNVTLKEEVKSLKTLKVKPTSAPKKTLKVKPISAPKKTRKVKSVKPPMVVVPVPLVKQPRAKLTDEEKAQRKREREVAKIAANNNAMGVPVAPIM
jgi:vacuolar-type H+-ATPase subunit I/STV1